jgi:hypothetical protein
MTKVELIEDVSQAVEMTRQDSDVIIEAIFDSVVRACSTRRGQGRDPRLWKLPHAPAAAAVTATFNATIAALAGSTTSILSP